MSLSAQLAILLGTFLFAGCPGTQRSVPPAPGQTAASTKVSATSPAAQELADAGEKRLTRGKELFVARCGSCHDADGSKPLRHGPPLNQRPLTDEAIASQVGQRFRSATAEDKQAAIAYVRSFLKPPTKCGSSCNGTRALPVPRR